MSRALLVIALAGGSAFAAPRYQRTQNVQIAVTISDRVKPLDRSPAPLVPSLTPADANALLGITLGIALPPADVEQLELAMANHPRAEQIFDYAMAITRRSHDSRGKDASAAKTELLKAVKAFKALVDNDAFETFGQLDVALFNYGFLLQTSKYLKEARAVYDRLLKNHPSSPYVPLAHLAFADYFYESQQVADAEARYTMVLKLDKSVVAAYAMYKLGWVHLQLQRFQQALEVMSRVVMLTRGNRAQAALGRAARRDFVVAYAQIGSADKALSAFKRLDAKAALEMYAQLAATYVASGSFDKAIGVYHDLVARAPADPNACTWQYMAARVMLGVGGSTDDKIREIEALAKLSVKSKDGECRANGTAMTTEIARALHSEATKTRNAETFGYAARMHRIVLATAPEPDTRWWLAEAEWSRAETEPANWLGAAEAFVDVASDTATPADRAREAALAAALAYKNALAIDPDLADLAKLDSKRSKTPLSKVETAMLEAFALYASIVKDAGDAELGTMLFVEAAIRRGHGDHATAVPVLLEYLRWHRDGPGGELASRMLLESREFVRSRSPSR